MMWMAGPFRDLFFRARLTGCVEHCFLDDWGRSLITLIIVLFMTGLVLCRLLIMLIIVFFFHEWVRNCQLKGKNPILLTPAQI